MQANLFRVSIGFGKLIVKELFLNWYRISNGCCESCVFFHSHFFWFFCPEIFIFSLDLSAQIKPRSYLKMCKMSFTNPNIMFAQSVWLIDPKLYLFYVCRDINATESTYKDHIFINEERPGLGFASGLTSAPHETNFRQGSTPNTSAELLF